MKKVAKRSKLFTVIYKIGGFVEEQERKIVEEASLSDGIIDSGSYTATVKILPAKTKTVSANRVPFCQS